MCYDIVTSLGFNVFISTAIVVNILEMCVWWYGMPESWEVGKEHLNTAVYFCFLVRNFLFLCCHQTLCIFKKLLSHCNLKLQTE
jgi:hypothetical protein